MFEKTRNKVYSIAVIMVAIATLVILIFTSGSHCFFGDDIMFGIYEPGENIIDCLFKNAGNEHAGGYFSRFLTKFFCTGLPMLLNIHPADFMCWGQSFFQAIFTIWFFQTYIKYLYFLKKIKSMYFIFYLFVCVFYFYTIERTSSTYILTNNNNFWRYTFTLVFFNIFFFYLYEMLIKKNVRMSKLTYILFFFSIVVCMTNLELLMYSCALFIVIVLIYNIIRKYMIIGNEHCNLYINKEKFFIPITLCFVTMLLFINSDGYKFMHGYRVVLDINYIKFIFHDFCVSYYTILFKDFVFYWIIFILTFCVAIRISTAKKENIKIILPAIMQICVLVVLFSLIICSKESNDGKLWLYRETIIFAYRMVSLIPIFIYLDYIFKNLKNYKRIFIKSIYWMIILLIVFMLIFNINIWNKRIHSTEKSNLRKINYIAEKMLRFYYLKNETPYLYKYKFGDDFGLHNFYRTKFNNNIDNMNKDITCNNGNKHIIYYFVKIYNEPEDKLKKLGVCYSDDAIDKFYANGGSFTKKELDNIYFERLKNDDFILEKPNKKLSVSDVTKEFKYGNNEFK